MSPDQNMQNFITCWNQHAIVRLKSISISETSCACSAHEVVILKKDGLEHEVRQSGTTLYLPEKLNMNLIKRRFLVLCRNETAYHEESTRERTNFLAELKECAIFLGYDISLEISEQMNIAQKKWSNMMQEAEKKNVDFLD